MSLDERDIIRIELLEAQNALKEKIENQRLRDYFACHFLANKWCVGMNQQETAKEAYKVADAMMEARKQ
jgi:predicted RNA polymerase sigma factor